MNIMLIITAAALAGCSHTADVQTDWPASQENGSVSTGIWSTEATSEEARTSRYEVCMEKLDGAEDAARICEDRMKAYRRKPLNWNPYYGYHYQQGDSK